MRGMLGAVLCAAAMLIAVDAQAAKLIAVLPLDVSNTKGKLDKAGQASIEEMLRDVATNALRPQGWTILSGENTIQVLRDNGVKPEECGAQSCHLANARELKAEAFISGTVQYVEGEFIASIRLIETKTGSLLTSERVRAKSVNTLTAEFEKQSNRFFERSGLLNGGTTAMSGEMPVAVPTFERSGPQVKTSRITAAVGSLTVTAKPKDAVRLELVDPNGTKIVSGAPYENKAAEPGRWQITATASGYEEETQEINLPADDVVLAKFELTALGALSVVGEPRGAAVEVSGPDGFSNEGGLPWEATGLQSGTYRVTVSRNGYVDANEKVEVTPGRTATVQVALQKGGSGGLTRIEPTSGLEFVKLPRGTFNFGCEPGDGECFSNEMPGRQETVGPFWLGKTEVTVEAYAKCVNAQECFRPKTDGACNWGVKGKEKYPINCVDWFQAKQFCGWIGGRLPTAEEWEYAAKGGESRIYPWGNSGPTAKMAKFDSSDGTVAVAIYSEGASKNGLMDMAGNVWEWTASGYKASSEKELRGGSWYREARYLRASHRHSGKPDEKSDHNGFRCVL